jgi:hypothetical protein
MEYHENKYCRENGLNPVPDGIIIHILRMDVLLGDRFVANRYTGPMDRFRVTGNQWMPGIQVLAFGQPPVGAGFREPSQFWNLLRGQYEAFGHQDGSTVVVGALARPGIQQVTGDPGIRDFTGFAILELLETASTAAVAKRFPLSTGHLRQGSDFPEGWGNGIFLWIIFHQQSIPF